jgi:hypothetical protein
MKMRFQGVLQRDAGKRTEVLLFGKYSLNPDSDRRNFDFTNYDFENCQVSSHHAALQLFALMTISRIGHG